MFSTINQCVCIAANAETHVPLASSLIDVSVHFSGAWTSAPSSRRSTTAFSLEESESQIFRCRKSPMVFTKS